MTAGVVASGSAYLANAVDFLPANSPDVTKSGAFTGAVNSAKGIISFWFRLDGSDANELTILRIPSTTYVAFEVSRTVGNKIKINGKNTSGGTSLLDVTSNSTFLAGISWHHVICAWDLSTSALQLYIDNASDVASVSLSVGDIGYASSITTMQIGNGAAVYDGCLAELYFAPDQYLDISVAANREKWISSAGSYQFLGNNGSLPTGTAPIMYMKNPFDTYGVNSGSGGDFTVTGTLIACSSRPGL